MTVFRFEFKEQFKSFFIWTISLVCLLLLFMVAIYPVFRDSIDDMIRVLSGFPPEFAAAFGFDLTSMFNFGGFYSVGFSYISLIGAIMAVSLAVSSFAREKRSKCVDFLLAKPISRQSIFVQKLLSGFCILIAANVLYVSVAIILGTANDTAMLLPALSLFFTQLVFYALGVFFATFAKKIRSVSGVATAFGFGAFVLSALVNIFEEEFIRFIAPLKYFDPTAIFSSGGLEGQFALTGALVFVLCLGLAFTRFIKSDAHAV